MKITPDLGKFASFDEVWATRKKSAHMFMVSERERQHFEKLLGRLVSIEEMQRIITALFNGTLALRR